MGQEHLKIYCSICFDWHLQSDIRVLICGHGYCVNDMDTMAQQGRRSCPKCRERCDIRQAHQIWLEYRDSRVPRDDDTLYGPPSSSRAGTPALQEDEEEAAERRAQHRVYSDAVHLQAQCVVGEVSMLSEQSSTREVSEAGRDLEKLVEDMGGSYEDKFQLLVSTLAVFMKTIAAPLFDQLHTIIKDVQAKDKTISKLRKSDNEMKHEMKAYRDKQVASERLLHQAIEEAATGTAKFKEAETRCETLIKEVGQERLRRRQAEDGAQLRLNKEKKYKVKIEELEQELRETRERLEEAHSQGPHLPLLVEDLDKEDGERPVEDVDLGAETQFRPQRNAQMERHASLDKWAFKFQPREFGSGWNLAEKPSSKRKRQDALPSVIRCDSQGHPKGAIQLGTRERMNKYS